MLPRKDHGFQYGHAPQSMKLQLLASHQKELHLHGGETANPLVIEQLNDTKNYKSSSPM